MIDAPDAILLEQFAKNGSEEAFTEIVRRRIGLVHSVALRQTQNAQHAEEITQAVFIILARKASSLGHKTILSGWLYHTARLTASNFRRAEIRRVHREQEVFMQSPAHDEQIDSAWQDLEPLLEDAMSKLGTTDRDAIVLRFFENKSLREVGSAMGLEERAAQKRVARGLEKLRAFFTKRGLVLSAGVIAGAVSAHSVQAGPAGLIATVSMTAAKGTAATASTLTLVKGVLKVMAWTKIKSASPGVLAISLAAAISIPLWSRPQNKSALRNPPRQDVSQSGAPAPLAAVQNQNIANVQPVQVANDGQSPSLINAKTPPVDNDEAAAADPSWRDRFDAAYKLKDGEVLRYIPQPFIPERQTYYQTEMSRSYQATGSRTGPDQFIFRQNEKGQFSRTAAGFGPPISRLRRFLFLGTPGLFQKFRNFEFEGNLNLLSINLPGDWTIREGTSREAFLSALEPILYQATDRKIHFEKRTVERDVLVAHGKMNKWKDDESTNQPEPIRIYAENPTRAGTETGDLQDLLGALGDDLGMYLVNQAQVGDQENRFTWNNNITAGFAWMGERRVELSKKVLENFSRQTGLTFTSERRAVEIWVISENK